ncbi:MAG: aldo/keto reductase [Alphaproteobacteria bacterium]|nr:aldo/keto reductase [Alphaproteobacteria bacterium]MBU0798518.1 aldo/keto reductase [Alphaproteobacteria bacterium]MBU0886202.1 aldo/keto reductase [Alphaproteobacteria bacterium]MBU1812842.1 aldo/keto reductase [Alphaproteobacteria bacterium]
MNRRQKNDTVCTDLSRADFLRLAGMALLGTGLGVTAGGASATTQEGRMLTRQIPSSGEALPSVGLGTWQQFDVAANAPEMAALRQVLELLFEGGGSVIDSSPMYGAAEERVGDLLAGMQARPKAFLATKVWTTGREAGLRQMERSAQLLRSPVIDLMQVHNLLDLAAHLPSLREWKAQGRIRYFGVTHYTSGALDELAQVIERETPDFVQLAYSPAVRAAEDRVLPLARDKGVAILVNRPFEGGGLFRKVRGQDIPDWAQPFAASWGQFFLKYILSEPTVTCVIPGTSNPRHVVDNLGAGQGRLPDAGERQRMIRYIEAL